MSVFQYGDVFPGFSDEDLNLADLANESASSDFGGLSDPELADILAGGTGHGDVLMNTPGGWMGAVNDALDSPLGKLATRAAPGLLGYLAAKKQTQPLQNASNQAIGAGAPSRARYEASFAPGFTMASDPGYSDALALTSKEVQHALSPGGNPVGSPNAWEQTQRDVSARLGLPHTYRLNADGCATSA